uniref:Immunoglobulin V-set domain-containing protein n=1 Tax=Chelydra serpentina TaxID=8475 RepID=A0A8C3XQU9_CHESE
MGMYIVWCAAMYLLGASKSLAGRWNSHPRHTAYLRCEQAYGHYSMFWYRQDPGQGLQLLFYFYYKEEREKGTNSSHFQADQPRDDVFRLNISSVQPEHSAVYFCASSSDTALQSHLLPLQKPRLFLVSLQPQHRKWQSGCHHMDSDQANSL